MTCYSHGYFSAMAGQVESYLLVDIAVSSCYVVESASAAINLDKHLNTLDFNNLKRAKIRSVLSPSFVPLD